MPESFSSSRVISLEKSMSCRVAIDLSSSIFFSSSTIGFSKSRPSGCILSILYDYLCPHRDCGVEFLDIAVVHPHTSGCGLHSYRGRIGGTVYAVVGF